MERIYSGSDVVANVTTWLSMPRELVAAVMKQPSNVANPRLIRQLYDASYVPGLFWICERVAEADFLKDENIRDYHEWARNITNASIELLKECGNYVNEFSDDTDKFLADSVLAALDLPYHGKALSACQTNQQADTLIWRILKLFAFGDSEHGLPTQRRFNEIGRRAITPILHVCDELPLDEMWRVVIDAGIIGAEVKERSLGTRMTGPASLRRAIPLETTSGLATPQMILDELMRRRTEALGIDFRQEYFAEVLTADAPRSVAWLTDDYIETAFDLKFIEAQIRSKPDLTFNVIPRDGSYRQDASFADIMELLAEEDSFAGLAELSRTGRLHICPAGPRASCIDGRMFSEEAATHLIEADVVVVKGARSYEMLQGLKKSTYYCLSGNHSFTESLTGLDMDLAQGILLRQDPGLLTYADFKARSIRRAYTRSGREYGLARMTASEYAAARRSTNYAAHLRRFGYREHDCNIWLLAEADRSGRTFSEVVLAQKP
jgi:hypothetical protein